MKQPFRTAAIQDTKRMEKAFRSFFFPFARVFRGCFFLESALCWQSQKRDKPSWSFFASLCPPVSHRQVAFGGCISFPKRLEGSKGAWSHSGALHPHRAVYRGHRRNRARSRTSFWGQQIFRTQGCNKIERFIWAIRWIYGLFICRYLHLFYSSFAI